MNSYNAHISKRVRRERREKQELVEHGIIILLMHFTHSLVLTQEQFNTVIAAIGEGLIPVPQQRPPLLPKNPVEDTDELHALFVEQYNTF